MRRIGKRGRQGLEANRRLKELYLAKGIAFCELNLEGCTGSYNMSFHHRHKRSSGFYINRPELLYDFKQVLLSCQNCHDKVEFNRELSDKLFLEKRGEE